MLEHHPSIDLVCARTFSRACGKHSEARARKKSKLVALSVFVASSLIHEVSSADESQGHEQARMTGVANSASEEPRVLERSPPPVLSSAAEPRRVFVKNVVALELSAPLLTLTATYERRLAPAFAVRTGIGGATFCGDVCRTDLVLPEIATILIPRDVHSLEIGAGVLLFPSLSFQGAPTGVLGYRYQPLQGALTIRMAFAVLLAGEKVVPFGTLAFGHAF